jgi:transposase-like protein
MRPAGIALRCRAFVTVMQAAKVRNLDDRSDTRTCRTCGHEFEKRWQRYEKPVALGWRVDETYIKVTSAGSESFDRTQAQQKTSTVTRAGWRNEGLK